MTLLNLKKLIKDRLTALSQISVYDGKAAENKTFPFLVYKFYQSNQAVRGRTDRVMEIEYHDNKDDDTAILTAAEKVKNGRTQTIQGVTTVYAGMDYSWQDETVGYYQCHIENEGEIPTQERNLSRFMQTYIIKER